MMIVLWFDRCDWLSVHWSQRFSIIINANNHFSFNHITHSRKKITQILTSTLLKFQLRCRHSSWIGLWDRLSWLLSTSLGIYISAEIWWAITFIETFHKSFDSRAQFVAMDISMKMGSCFRCCCFFLRFILRKSNYTVTNRIIAFRHLCGWNGAFETISILMVEGLVDSVFGNCAAENRLAYGNKFILF